MKKIYAMLLAGLIIATFCACSSNSAGLSNVPGHNNSASEISNAGTSSQLLESVIMDKNKVKVTYKGIVKKTAPAKGYDIQLRIENDSTKDYTLQVRNLALNGVMAKSNVFSPEIAPGKISNDPIWVINLEEEGINPPINTAEFSLVVLDSKTLETAFESGAISIKS